MVGDVRFAQMAGGQEIAYRLVSEGDGPVILHTPSGPFPLDLLNEEPMYDLFLRTLSGSGRLVLYDKPGIGSSDPIDPDRDFLDQMADAHVAVLDAVGAEAAWIVGSTLSAIARTIQTHPARALGAVLINPLSPAQFQRGVDSAVERQRKVRIELNPSRAGDPAFVDWLRRASRLGSSASEGAAFLSANRAALAVPGRRPGQSWMGRRSC